MAKNQIGDGPIDERYLAEMNTLALAVDQFLNAEDMVDKRTGFVLLVFPIGPVEGRCNYISNADRGDVVRLLKEQLAKFERQGL